MKKLKPEKYNWSQVDWSKPDPQIARAIGCSSTTVQHARKRHRKSKVEAYPKWFSTVDWLQSNRAIAKQFGKTEAQVRGARQRYANGVRAEFRASRKRNMESYIERIRAFNDWRIGKADEYPSTAEQLTKDLQRATAALSERKTVHEWLNILGIPTKEETGKPMCLLRRLSVALSISAISSGKEALQELAEAIKSK